MVTSILAFVFGIGLIVTIHELGHLLMAKKAGVYCYEFSIGMGPKLFRKKFGETYYSISLLPIGGYVSMAGEETNVEDLEIPIERRMDGANRLSKFLITIAGVTMNFLLALLLYLIISIAQGQSSEKSIIGSVVENTTADRVGLLENDRIIEVEGQKVNTWSEVATLIKEEERSRDIEIKLDRSGEELDYSINPAIIINSLGIKSDENSVYETKVGEVVEQQKAYQAGIKKGDVIKKIITSDEIIDINIDFENNKYEWDKIVNYFENYDEVEEIKITVMREDGDEIKYIDVTVEPYSKNFLNEAAGIGTVSYSLGVSAETERTITGVLSDTGTRFVNSSTQIVKTFKLLFTSDETGINDLGGVFTIINVSGQAASAGFITLLAFIALFSVNVGILNLLPLPALDGGRILFIMIETVRRKSINPKIENTIHGIGILLLFGFMIYITFVDILRFI